MNVWKPIALIATVGLVGSLGLQIAHADAAAWSCPGHDNLSKAWGALGGALGHMGNAQKANDFDMKNHASNAKGLITQAQGEIVSACTVLNGK